ncbi:ankyrin repeat domain-containing protein [uncultured Sphingomonas sp.]|uniref:ankyrin repeat domain-containing protein n=1 Tax=uncultured Sphingomonas sp. TaxID=158754 RepID=UPI0025F6106F|nr:ankyrin repeat domain-containing protein [uncultured Sphingomonas sp.]
MSVLRLALAAALMLPAAAHAQQMSPGYLFLKAIRDEDGNKVNDILGQPGQTIINTKDRTTGEGALHIVAKNGNLTYLRFLLAKGANPNLQDNRGNTAALLAVESGSVEAINALAQRKANLNLGNSSGETPLIRAVQLRNLDMVRTLIAAGANPDQADVMAGMSARDYAKRDTRTPALLKLFDEAPAAKPKAPVAGPRF